MVSDSAREAGLGHSEELLFVDVTGKKGPGYDSHLSTRLSGNDDLSVVDKLEEMLVECNIYSGVKSSIVAGGFSGWIFSSPKRQCGHFDWKYS